jgi:hypothetical protein
MLLDAFDSNWIAPGRSRPRRLRVGAGGPGRCRATPWPSPAVRPRLHLSLLLAGVGAGRRGAGPLVHLRGHRGGGDLPRVPPRVRRLLPVHVDHRPGPGGHELSPSGPGTGGSPPPWSPSTSTASAPTTTQLSALCDSYRHPAGRGRRRGPRVPRTGGSRPAASGPPACSRSTGTRSSPPAPAVHAGVTFGFRGGRTGPAPGHPGSRPVPPLRALRHRLQLPAQQPVGRTGEGPAPSISTGGSTGAGGSTQPTGTPSATSRGSGSCPSPEYGEPNWWLTCITVDPVAFGADREQIRLALEAVDIESRPTWKPLHLQPVYAGSTDGRWQWCVPPSSSAGCACPAGSALSATDQERVVETIKSVPG